MSGIKDEWIDELTLEELVKRDELINVGIAECRNLLGKQKTRQDYFSYEGSIDGFEECRKLARFSDFETRLYELHKEINGEVSKSSLKDGLLKEQLGIYDKNAKTDIDEVWRLKGIRTQVEFVYERLKGFRIAVSLLKKARERARENPTYRSAYSYYSV